MCLAACASGEPADGVEGLDPHYEAADSDPIKEPPPMVSAAADADVLPPRSTLKSPLDLTVQRAFSLMIARAC